MFKFEVFDDRFYDLVDVEEVQKKNQLEAVSCGHFVTEGIIWWPQHDCLIFSDMKVGKVYKWDPKTYETTVIKYPSNINNGNFIDPEGRIVSCEHATSSITRMETINGTEYIRRVHTLASHYDGKELNSPNDVIVDSKGRIWFSDPTYGRGNGPAGFPRPLEMGFQGVYCIDTDGTLILSRKDYPCPGDQNDPATRNQPNGLCMEDGEKTMLVNDTPQKVIYRFNVEDDCTLSGGEIVCHTDGRPDGTKVDKDGNIWTTISGDMEVFDKNGVKLAIITLPGQCRNFCFGGENNDYIFFACESIYRMKLKTQGRKFF